MTAFLQLGSTFTITLTGVRYSNNQGKFPFYTSDTLQGHSLDSYERVRRLIDTKSHYTVAHMAICMLQKYI